MAAAATLSPDAAPPPPPPSVTAQNPASPYGTAPTTLSAPQIASYCVSAGFSGQSLITAIAIALAESGGRTSAHNSYTEGGATYDVWGLFQISTVHQTAGGIAVSQATATDPLLNARMAYALSSGGRNWLPWQTYNGPASQGYNDAYFKFIAQAAAAAQGAQAAGGGTTAILTDATLTPPDAGTGQPDTNPADGPLQYAFKGQSTTYKPVVPVWHIDDITVSLISATDGAPQQAAPKKLDGIPVTVGGAQSTLKDLLVSATVQMDNSQSTQVTLTFEHGDLLTAYGLFFPADPATAVSMVTIRDLPLAVASCSLVADAAQRPQLQVHCISLTQMRMMNAFPPDGATAGGQNPYSPVGVVVENPNATTTDANGNTVLPAATPPTSSTESAADYVVRVSKLFGATAYCETDNADPITGARNSTLAGQPQTANLAGYNPFGNPSSGALPDSVWVYTQRLAQYLGFWFYETSGSIWFAQPHTLADWGNKLPVNFCSIESGLTPDSTAPIGTPTLAANIEETPGGFATPNHRQIVRTCTVQLAPWYGCQARPGDELVLSGFSAAAIIPLKPISPWDTNPAAPDSWTGVGASKTGQWPKPGQKYIITSVQFAIDGGVTPVTVTAEEVQDPNPSSTFNAATGQITPEYGAGASQTGSGYNTTAYYTPSTVEASLPSDYRTGKRATDALKLATGQIGVPYTWGGTSPQSGFDCSGLVYYAAVQTGVDPTNQPRTSPQLWNAILAGRTQMSVQQALNEPFALLFPADPSSSPSHVAISLGDGKSILQASQTGTPVNISTIDQNQWLVQAGRLPSLAYPAPNTPAPGQSPDAVPTVTA